MIQALNIKNINPKALTGAKGKATEGEASLVDPESALDNADFANELMASLADQEAELAVQPVQVNPEQILQSPSGLISLPESELNQKVFDPALTNDVHNLIQPKTTAVVSDEQVMALADNDQLQAVLAQNLEAPEGQVAIDAKGELSQAMLKTPQINQQGGRSPAIDFAPTEIDPQLMNMEDFVNQKNAVAKKNLQTSGYGAPKTHMHKVALENGLKPSQVIKDPNSLEGMGAQAQGQSAPVNSQQFILSMQSELGNQKLNEATVPVKTFDMSQIKTENPNQIMNQIADYIVQAKAAKEPTVNMRVNHDELGIIDITVNKSAGLVGQDSIAINIGTHSIDGKNFFQANSKDLFSHLTQAGLNVTDMKVETPTQTAKNDFDMGSQSGRHSGAGSDKHYGSESNQKRQDSDRRQDLWNLLKDKEAA